MFVCGIEYELLETKEKITIADSFIKGGNKIGDGHGEAKLYVGQKTDNFTLDFFDLTYNTTRPIKCFITRQDLLQYLYDTADEYKFPTQNYISKSDMPNLWQNRLDKISLLPDLLEFELFYQNEIQGPRIYLNSQNRNDINYTLIREISLPNLSFLSCLKLKRLSDNQLFFYFRIFADLPTTENKILENSTEIAQIKKIRIGQAKYRELLLKECPFCPITMVNYDRLLVASHIKPYAKCNEQEQYDPKNGLMLTPTIDKLFDQGFISFNENKKILLSPWISKHTFNCLNLAPNQIYQNLPFDDKRLFYMEYHNKSVFKA